MKKIIYLLLAVISTAILAGCSTVGSSSMSDVIPMKSQAPSNATETAPEATTKPSETAQANTNISGPKVGDKSDANVGGKNRGSNFHESDPAIVDLMQQNAGKFVQETYYDSKTGITLAYSLFVPKDYDKNQAYPMLMYIPDASAGGKSAKDIVEQYFGADIWVTDEEQAKHPSFVVVPAFSEVVVDDNFTTSKAD